MAGPGFQSVLAGPLEQSLGPFQKVISVNKYQHKVFNGNSPWSLQIAIDLGLEMADDQ